MARFNIVRAVGGCTNRTARTTEERRLSRSVTVTLRRHQKKSARKTGYRTKRLNRLKKIDRLRTENQNRQANDASVKCSAVGTWGPTTAMQVCSPHHTWQAITVGTWGPTTAMQVCSPHHTWQAITPARYGEGTFTIKHNADTGEKGHHYTTPQRRGAGTWLGHCSMQ